MRAAWLSEWGEQPIPRAPVWVRVILLALGLALVSDEGMDLLLLALCVALVAWSVRGLRRWLEQSARRNRRRGLPGLTADQPLVLTSPRVIEEAREAVRCECGGRVKELGETSRLGLRVARGRCVECDADVDLYFVLPSLLN